MYHKTIHIASKSILQILFLLLCIPTIAQQDGLFSQYMVNHFVINPAYAGSRDAVSTFLINRNQWISIPG
ncbi:MAG: type IX secretion system membrane protein PorP/SprF, partial [Bacteroidia bacterium]